MALVFDLMLEVLFSLAAIAHLALLYISFRYPGAPEVWLVRLLLCGLILDNVLLALATIAINEDWYVAATIIRYTAHALLLPPLVVAGTLLARRAGVGMAAHALALPAAVLLALAGMAYGVAMESLNHEFVRETLYGHVRLVSVDAAPPLATILTNVVLLGISAAIWRASGWKWLFLGILQIFIINGATATQDWSIISGNLAEIFFAVSWIATLGYFVGRND